MAARGVFISVEGGEGVGKSVFLGRLADGLRARGVTLVTTREPGGTPGADRIRTLFGEPAAGDPWTIEAEALLVSAARAQHVGRLVRPRLEAGTWVVSDRFHDSMRVYQGALLGVDPVWLEQLIAGSTGGLDPDVTFLLDLDVKAAQARVKGRADVAGAIARYDQGKLEQHETLRAAFLTLAKRHPARFVILDAGEAPEVVSAKALAVVKERFGLG